MESNTRGAALRGRSFAFYKYQVWKVILGVCLLLPGVSEASTGTLQFKDLKLASNSQLSVSGKLARGTKVDLGWASRSAVACFPRTLNEHFSGNHVLYRVALPAQSVLDIELVPKRKDLDLSLYAYSVRKGDTRTRPPKVTGVVSCEASVGSRNLKNRFNPGEIENVSINATTHAYTAYIGVAGAKKIKKGDFKLVLSLRTAPPEATGKVTNAKNVKLKANGITKVKGNLKGGPEVSLRWAANSSVACFPATRNQHYNGAHKLYRVKLPRYSELKIKAKPKKKNFDVSLYAYSVGHGDKKTLPPKIPGVVSCEASAGSRSRSAPFNPGKAESVRLNATTNPYTAYIGVTAAKGVMKGDFELEFDLKVRAPEPTAVVASATPLSVRVGETISKQGKIDGGPEISLQWAANSSVACFPATRKEHYNGAHTLYSVPLPSYSEVTITLTPKDSKSDLSLYAYSVGPQNKNMLPPNVPSVVSCEASAGRRSVHEPFNPGETEQVKLMALRNPYHVLIGVTGAKKLKKGAFKLDVALKKR